MYGQQGGYPQQYGYQQQYPQQDYQQGYDVAPQQSYAQQQQPAPTPAVVEDKIAPIYVDTQHDDMVHDAQLDFYGTKLATSSSGECFKTGSD
jgi:hypothetical protein